jgi:hypothetical protein
LLPLMKNKQIPSTEWISLDSTLFMLEDIYFKALNGELISLIPWISDEGIQCVLADWPISKSYSLIGKGMACKSYSGLPFWHSEFWRCIAPSMSDMKWYLLYCTCFVYDLSHILRSFLTNFKSMDCNIMYMYVCVIIYTQPSAVQVTLGISAHEAYYRAF